MQIYTPQISDGNQFANISERQNTGNGKVFMIRFENQGLAPLRPSSLSNTSSSSMGISLPSLEFRKKIKFVALCFQLVKDYVEEVGLIRITDD